MARITGTDGREQTDNEQQDLESQQKDAKVNGTFVNGHGMENGNEALSSSGEHSSGESTPDSGKEEEVGTKNGEAEKEGENKDQEIVLIQDTGFTVKISASGIDDFDLPVSSMELVQEIHQVLMDREDTCHRTCFSLQLEGVTLDNFAELKNIEGLHEGSVIRVIEEPYTVREARIHVRHVRDLLKSVDSAESYNGVDCNSLSFLNVVAGDLLDKKRSRPDSVDCTPPDFIMPGSKDRPLQPLHPGIKELRGPQCLKVLTYSGWNPPPGPRRLHGDLLYLYVVTLEEKRYHITASSRGFFLNQSTEDKYDWHASQPKYLSHSLIDLLNQVSPAFKKNFSALLKRRAQKHPYERVPTPYQVYSWMAPQPDHSVDYIRAEDAFSTRLGYEEHIPGQTRDWNEEIQTTRELPRKNLPERLVRERAIFKVHSDFVAAATRGAMAVIDGNVMAINPGEDTKMQMFIWNNIFFSLGFDVKDHYKDFGGDYAAFSAPVNDLQGVKAYFGVDLEGLYTLGTVIVDYRGYRVTAQSIIPGILEREQEQSVVYGSVDFGKTVVTHDKYRELLLKTAEQLKIRPHKVINSKDEEVELFSSIECKGIIGNDQRHYILDLLRTFPPDVNFLPVDSSELSEAMREQGFPRKHRHLLACLRQELIEQFHENRYVAFVRHAAYQFQQLQLKQQIAGADAKKEGEEEKPTEAEAADAAAEAIKALEAAKAADAVGKATEGVQEGEEKPKTQEELATEEAKKIMENLTSSDGHTLEEHTKEVIKKASQVVGSLTDTSFVIAFNPDVYQPHVRHVDPEGEMLKKEKQLVKDAAEFLVVHQIPMLVSDCLDHTSAPIDGITLVEAMHNRGINIRYLGKVAEVCKKYPTISYVYTIAIGELIVRGTKHLFRGYMQGVDQMNLASALAHFLNCFLGCISSPHIQPPVDEGKAAKRKNKKKSKHSSVYSSECTEWLSETPRSLWRKIVDEVEDYFGFPLECDSIETAVEKYGLQRISLLRGLCLRVGIQLQLRDYHLDARNRQIFNEDDIINVFPVVKHIHPKATDAYHFFTSGQGKIQQGLLREGYELISEAQNLLTNVYGAMHPEVAACLRLLARLNYIMGDYAEALSFQQRAVLMSERVLGIDHPNTITEYAHLALYCFANNQVSSSLRLMYRTRYLALLCHGENHPEVALIDSNIGLILHAVEEYDLSLRFLENALALNSKFFGATNLKTALSYHLVARTHSCRGDFRAALQNEKEAYAIYKQVLGETHERTRESSECLKHLTHQAVVFQKKMNEICKGEKTTGFPPIQIHTPSLASVLDTLNVINGIVFVQISQEDIEKFRQEMKKSQASSEEKGDKASNSDSIHNSTKTDGLAAPGETGVKEGTTAVTPDLEGTAASVPMGEVKA